MTGLWSWIRAKFEVTEVVTAEQLEARVAEVVAYLKSNARECLEIVPVEQSSGSWLGGSALLLGSGTRRPLRRLFKIVDDPAVLLGLVAPRPCSGGGGPV
jgi:hypothetical protein